MGVSEPAARRSATAPFQRSSVAVSTIINNIIYIDTATDTAHVAAWRSSVGSSVNRRNDEHLGHAATLLGARLPLGSKTNTPLPTVFGGR